MASAWTLASWLCAASVQGLQGPGDESVVRPFAPASESSPGHPRAAAHNGKFDLVSWHGQTIPLAEPVCSCAFGCAADGATLAILAGGVQESLDLYLVDRSGAVLYRFTTDGGRRLPFGFNGDSGSLPCFDGASLMLFAFEKDAHVQFRAVDLSGGVHAARELPLSVTGFRMESDPKSSRVRVEFTGSGEPVEFDHPLAPKLEIDSRTVTFPTRRLGERSTGAVVFRNRGRRPLELRLVPQGAEFTLEGPDRLSIGAGQQVRVNLAFAPLVAGAREGALRIGSSSQPHETSVALRGQSVGASVPETSKPESRDADVDDAPVALAPERTPHEPLPEAITIRRLGSEIEIAGQPLRTYLVASVVEAEPGRVQHALFVLRGSFGSDGKARIPLTTLDQRREILSLVAFMRDTDGRTLRSELTRLDLQRKR